MEYTSKIKWKTFTSFHWNVVIVTDAVKIEVYDVLFLFVAFYTYNKLATMSKPRHAVICFTYAKTTVQISCAVTLPVPLFSSHRLYNSKI